MSYTDELTSASTQALDAYTAITQWLDRPITAGESVPTAELEKRVKELRASRERLMQLKDAHGETPEILDAIATNTHYFRKIGVTLPEEVVP